MYWWPSSGTNFWDEDTRGDEEGGGRGNITYIDEGFCTER